MIVFIANYPDVDNLRDGMMQRIAAIDTLANDKLRVYLDISFKRNIRRKKTINGNCIIERLNFFMHFNQIKKYLLDSELVYVHSLYNMLKVFFIYDSKKTILDIHGVVPEELELTNRNNIAKIYSIMERKVFKNCSLLIHVTNSMLEFYEKKYGVELKKRSLVLPIFEYNHIARNTSKWNSDTITAVYVGGMQKWQNIDLMVASVARLNKASSGAHCIRFGFFFPLKFIKSFSEMYRNICEMDNVTIGSLPKDEMLSLLSKSHVGFVLRDSIIVNQVACPTKLIEYLECGVVPIVKSPDIGDFDKLGYKYINIDEINRLSELNIKAMAEHNFDVLDKYHKKSIESKTILESILIGVNA
ncbi:MULTISPECIES: glycosyltransferase family protein [Aeromonas]|uniref:hypothetical protein n=1 Tax=Aeromonas TaxID=642 RepID=UPI0034A1F709